MKWPPRILLSFEQRERERKGERERERSIEEMGKREEYMESFFFFLQKCHKPLFPRITIYFI
jgi:hypothetical protein